MFSSRTNSQKPKDELLSAFKQNFATLKKSLSGSDSTEDISAPANDAAAVGNMQHQSGQHELPEIKDHDLTPRASVDQWRFTPSSLMDPNSFSFAHFANQPPGYYTPTPGGLNTVYHNQTAGDLHTPGMAFHLGTPLSMPMADATLHVTPSFDLHNYQPQMFQSQVFHHQQQNFAQTQSFAPSLLVHQDSGYDAMNDSPEQEEKQKADLVRIAKPGSNQMFLFQGNTISAPPHPGSEQFRYQATLHAPTAMIRHSDEIPITYLNKGQAYSISIVDSLPQPPSQLPVKYRTVIRISFEDEQQRRRPSACWQLWKEGRGLAEAHQRSGKLQAVEYVDPSFSSGDDSKKGHVELESASFDSFAVTWSPSSTSMNPECSVSVRFNFLSTDFSHSKGVKGIPVRLCAKTETVSSSTPDSPPGQNPEVCYCKVKLFRDHGAERKLSNDVAHVKKTIDKLKQQIAQADAGMKDYGSKRKRSGSIITKEGERPNKILKHKRTWSVSSQNSGSGRGGADDDLHAKLQAVQDMFSSTRPSSLLYLKGLDSDDPDAFPVTLPGEPRDLTKVPSRTGSWEHRQSGEGSTASSLSPGQSPQSNHSKAHQLQHRNTWESTATHESDLLSDIFQEPNFSRVPTKVAKADGEWVDAIGVDGTYVPPPPTFPKAVACVYILANVCGVGPSDNYYRAVYLHQKNLQGLVAAVAAKCELDESRIIRTLRVTKSGLESLVDDEVVQQMTEGQDMLVNVMEVPCENIKHEAMVLDGDSSAPARLQIQLVF